MKQTLLIGFFLCILCGFISCKKSTETFQTDSISEYYPLQVGKYVSYRLDSMVFVNFGGSSVIRSYDVKYEVDAEITDNLGRPSFRVFRYIRNNSTQPWTPDASFLVTNATTSLEFTENNLKYQKLKSPIRDYYSWKGNSFIDTYSQYSTVRYLDDWDYVYENVGQPAQVGGFALDKTLTVTQRDEIIGNPADPNAYAEVNFCEEKYASGIGLVYRKFIHTEYQPPVPGLGGYYVEGSYGVTYTIIDHN